MYSRRRFKYTVLLFSLSSGACSIWNAFLVAYILFLVKDSVHHETDFTCAFFGFIAWLHASMMVSRRAIAAEKTLSAERISAFRHLPLRNSAIRYSGIFPSLPFLCYIRGVSVGIAGLAAVPHVNITLWSLVVHPSTTDHFLTSFKTPRETRVISMVEAEVGDNPDSPGQARSPHHGYPHDDSAIEVILRLHRPK